MPENLIPTSPIQVSPYITTSFPVVFTEAEAAKWLRVSKITLQRIRLRGEIAFSRVGGCRIVYTERQLKDYLAARERPCIR